jgi:L-lactate dehydrogenase complex protein LldE
MKVSLFITCVADQLFPEVGESVVRVLERCGCTVDFPKAQVCCGQPAFNAGHIDDARRAARALLTCFEESDYVISPSGSCCGMIRHHFEHLFANDGHDRARAHKLAEKTYEFSQFMVNKLNVIDVGASFPHRVTYHPSCHAMRLLGVGEEPLKLIRAVRDIEFAELPRAEDCCGFGGTFSVKLSRISGAIVDEKVDHVVETGARYVVGTDMGCLMNIEGRMQARNIDVRAMHLAQLLDAASPSSASPQGEQARS